MMLEIIDPPRKFQAGFEEKRTISDCCHITLHPDEQVTFTNGSTIEYDVCRKDFGFYATPSLNSRLLKYNLRAVLVKNRIELFFVLLVEKGKEELFYEYLNEEKMVVVKWIDNTDDLRQIE